MSNIICRPAKAFKNVYLVKLTKLAFIKSPFIVFKRLKINIDLFVRLAYNVIKHAKGRNQP